MSMLFSLLNQRDNAVINGNRKLAPFLKVQLPHSVMVNGKVEQYSPNHPYTGMDLETIEAMNIKEGKLGGSIDPNNVLKQPDPEWSPNDSEIRKFGDNAQGNAKPTSSALQTILYDPKLNIVHYNFRGGSKTYHSIMSNSLFNQWITSPSIGKFWNKYLRTGGKGGLPRANGVTTYKLPSAGEPTNGMPTNGMPTNGMPTSSTPVSPSNSVSTTNPFYKVIQSFDNNPLPTISQWEILRMLLKKITGK
jgi:hypothetical protein